MITLMQNTLKKSHLIELCRLLHPDLTDIELERLKYSRQYSWVTVDFKAEGKHISFGLDNHSQSPYHSLWGNRVSKKDIEHALKHKRISTRVWRFKLDSLCNNPTADPMQNEGVLNWIKHNIQPPTVDEFYNYYYSD